MCTQWESAMRAFTVPSLSVISVGGLADPQISFSSTKWNRNSSSDWSWDTSEPLV